MPSLASLSGRFDMMGMLAAQEDYLAAALAAPKTPVAKAMKPLAEVKQDQGAALIRAMRLDAPEANPLAYRNRVVAYTSGT